MSTSTAQISYSPSSPVLFRLFHNEVPAGDRIYFPHSHPEYEITIFLSGYGVYTVGRGREYDVEPGDVFLFRGNEEHFMAHIDPGEDVRTVGIHFLPHFILDRSSDLFDIQYLRAFLTGDGFSHRLPRNTPAARVIAGLMSSMKAEYDGRKRDYELMIKAKLLTALVEINRCALPGEGGLPRVTSAQALLISRSMQYIDEHVTEPLRLEELAAGAGLSVSRYSRLFRLVSLVSPMDYVLRKRVDLAKSLLVHSDGTVLEIAVRCGFNSTANFNRAFLRRTGLVPSVFRRQARLGGSETEL